MSKLETVWIIGLIMPGQQRNTEPQYGYYAGWRKMNPEDPHCKPQPSLNLDPNGAMKFKSKEKAEAFRLTLEGPSRFTVMEHTFFIK